MLGLQGDPESDDAKIVDVLPNSPAAKAGVQPGDIVLAFDGKKVTDFDSLAEMVRGSKVGQKVKLSIQRGEEKLELEAELAKRTE